MINFHLVTKTNTKTSPNKKQWFHWELWWWDIKKDRILFLSF